MENAEERMRRKREKERRSEEEEEEEEKEEEEVDVGMKDETPIFYSPLSDFLCRLIEDQRCRPSLRHRRCRHQRRHHRHSLYFHIRRIPMNFRGDKTRCSLRPLPPRNFHSYYHRRYRSHRRHR